MNIIKSIIVIIILLGLSILSTVLIIKCVKLPNKEKNLRRYFITAAIVIATIVSIVFLGDYAYPFERKIKPVLIAEFEVPEEHALDYPGQKFWRGAYKECGLYAHSLYFNPNKQDSMYGFGWPPMDFDTYNYIITYGQKIEKLTYNVWDILDEQIMTGAKVGHMILDDDFQPNKVFIYRISKVRIENDVNDINSPWD